MIQRYTIRDGIPGALGIRDTDGDWVKYEDHQQAIEDAAQDSYDAGYGDGLNDGNPPVPGA